MPTAPDPRARLDAVDGLRGVAIILVVLSHGWTLWPTSVITSHGWVEPIFRSGDSAVTIFLVASGFLMFRSVAASDVRVQMQPLLVAVRRVLRVGPAMWAVLLAVMVVAAIDVTDIETKQTNSDSLWHALTYTYNWLVQENLTATRMDLGHLWYVSVDMQAVVVVAVIAFFLRHRPTALLVSLGSLFVVLVIWRFHAYSIENIYIVLNRTTVRMDPFIIGALAAALVPRLPAADAYYRYASRFTLGLMLPVLYWCYRDSSYLRWGGTLLEILVAVFLVCVALAPPRTQRIRGSEALLLLGRMSLVIYVWHFPIFHFVSRHTYDWDWPWKVVVAFAATALISAAAHVVVERPVSRFLARPEWDALREGDVRRLAKKIPGRLPGRTTTRTPG